MENDLLSCFQSNDLASVGRAGQRSIMEV